MGKVITKCPSCNSSDVMITRIECSNCDTKFEGKFEVPELLQLSNEELDFVQIFVKSSGSLKEMSKIFEVSYPTMRNRLNDIIGKLLKFSGKEC